MAESFTRAIAQWFGFLRPSVALCPAVVRTTAGTYRSPPGPFRVIR